MDAGRTVRTAWAGLDLEHDPMPTTPDAVASMPSDIVLPPSRTTETLATLMVRRPVRRTLDIGTGCGALALLAARFSDEVIATDVNPRALALTELNAERNGVDHLRCLRGGLTEPISFERFGLVLANLPFVISPPNSGLTFRDGLRSTDDPENIARAAVAEASEVLEPGGYAELLVNWIVTSPERVYEEPVGWIRPTGHDALVLLHSLQSPEDYVDRWATTRSDDRGAWLGHLEALGATAVANGVVVVRARIPDDGRCDRPARIRTARMTTSPRGRGGEQVAHIVEAEAPSDADLLAGRPTAVSPRTWVDAESADGEPRRRLVSPHTCGVTAVVRPPFDRIIDELDGETGLDEAVRRWADRHGIDDRRTIHDIIDATVETVRRLVSTGLATVETVSR